MALALNPTRSAFGGCAAMMACACSIAGQTAQMVALGGIAATTITVHPVFVLASAAFVIYGLWRTSRTSGYLAAAAAVALAGALALTPEMSMVAETMPWHASLYAGAGLYVVAGLALGAAFWRAFPTPQPEASGMAIGGAALATGCGCCLVTGATSSLAVTAGASAAWIKPETAMSLVGLLAVFLGLFRLGGFRAARWVPVGYVLFIWAPKLLKLTGDWMIGGINVRVLPSYAIAVAGAGIIIYGFAVAFGTANARAREGSALRVGLEPAVGAAGD